MPGSTPAVNAFIVRKGNPGLRTAKIQNKIALRCVQNADMTFNQCFVPDSARLPGVANFADTNKVLAISRIMVAWQPVGMSVGVYDMCVRYLSERKQFGAPLGSFQLVQERLARMGGSIQAFNDMEAIYTYEGTYDVNVLVAGRGITGASAIRPATKPPAKKQEGDAAEAARPKRH
ncbi:hypothetical protein GPECTOR_16g583 [Gonium pectorale]|uniref:Acyl-CoA dehydrogenase/oxidase C-terminal domain-containing protein n=1 Tax=Gonium pectorale TaxID=33097 RepID=A0A150GKN0_GONPE|nr:hypothetical protein GPECTOR_16g583 [Gonium pectorale]|eukprot:KXZ50409.1 hypothetical protein GPECTOR_16g583 [Gonium pectorale]